MCMRDPAGGLAHSRCSVNGGYYEPPRVFLLATGISASRVGKASCVSCTEAVPVLERNWPVDKGVLCKLQRDITLLRPETFKNQRVPSDDTREKDPEMMGRDLPKVTQLSAPVLSKWREKICYFSRRSRWH